MTDRAGNGLLAAVLAAALQVSCGGDESGSAGNAPGTSPANTVGTGTVTLAWSAPIENTDGTAITDLAGYRIYHGTSELDMDTVIQVSNPGISIYVVDSLSTGAHYFAVTAYNASGAESARSEVAIKTVM